MTKTVVALYDSATDAETVIRDLSAAGFTDTEVIDNSAVGSAMGSDRAAWRDTDVTDASLAGGAPGVIGTPLGAAPEAGATAPSGAVSNGIMSRLSRAGVPEEDSHIYAEGVRRGGSLVIARLSDDDVDRGLEIMSSHRPVDIDERGSRWRQEGWSRYDESAGPYTGTGLTDAATSMRGANETTGTTGTGEETVIPIVEEQLSVVSVMSVAARSGSAAMSSKPRSRRVSGCVTKPSMWNAARSIVRPTSPRTTSASGRST